MIRQRTARVYIVVPCPCGASVCAVHPFARLHESRAILLGEHVAPLEVVSERLGHSAMGAHRSGAGCELAALGP